MPPPINPNATPEARELLRSLQNLSGKGTLSGQHNTPEKLSSYSDQAAKITGKYPALWGQDLGFAADGQDGIIHRQAVIDEAKRQHKAGSIITLMWHCVRPTDKEPGTFKENVCGPVSADEWRQMVMPGTTIHGNWASQVDTIAAFLRQLRDARIPVLWRPYHEMNGGWFWWGKRPGPDGYTALWKQIYHRLVNVHRLDNLLWVWNPNAPSPDPTNVLPYAACFPGQDKVDVLAADIYRNDFRQSHHDDLLRLAGGKPIALGEVGAAPTPAVLETQPYWTWFMIWTGRLTSDNTPQSLQSLYNYRRVEVRDLRRKL